MEILQQDLGPTLREAAMQAATAALSSWDTARERGTEARERVRHAADEASGAVEELVASGEHVRDDVVHAAESAAREARERADEAARLADSGGESGKRRFWRATDDAQDTLERTENGLDETIERIEDQIHTGHASEEHRSKAGLFWGGAGLGLALYALLDAERREKVVQLANEASVQIQELVRDLQGYDDEF
jgi:hypothetical protein